MDWLKPAVEQEDKEETNEVSEVSEVKQVPEIEEKQKEQEDIENEKKSFEDYCKEMKIKKKIKKHGISIGITFTKEEQKNFGLEYGDEIDLTGAKVIKNNK